VKESNETFKAKFYLEIKFYARLTNQVHERVLPEKPTDPQLINKFPAFYGTRSFITAFKSIRHLALSSAQALQSIPPNSTF
jgi:hypothetical protein